MEFSVCSKLCNERQLPIKKSNTKEMPTNINDNFPSIFKLSSLITYFDFFEYFIIDYI